MRLALLAVLLAATAPARAQAAPADSSARPVVEATGAFFEAMAARDTTALRALLHPDAQIVAVSPDGQVQVGRADGWVRAVSRSEVALHERIRDPRVEVAGDLATLWAPYDFHLGDRFSHCGTDAFQFVRDGTV